MNPAQLAALLQLASPSLPVGAYSYSQGLEGAVEDGLIRGEADTARWIGDLLKLLVARYEAPVWLRLHAAAMCADHSGFQHWNAHYLASRESSELLAETRQMGWSLRRLLPELGHRAPPGGDAALAFVAAHAWACAQFHIPAQDGLIAYLYAWAENQVLAAIKCVPLGQLAGQRLLLGLQPVLTDAARHASGIEDDALHNGAPLYAITSSRHETQYSRLFRS